MLVKSVTGQSSAAVMHIIVSDAAAAIRAKETYITMKVNVTDKFGLILSWANFSSFELHFLPSVFSSSSACLTHGTHSMKRKNESIRTNNSTHF